MTHKLYEKHDKCIFKKRLKENNDCAVIAIAVACKITYKKAHSICKKLGRKNGRGLRTFTILQAIKKAGYEIEFNTFGLKQPNGSKYTPKTIERAVKLNGMYLAFTGDHVFAIKEKEVICWCKNRSLHINRLVKIGDKI